MKIISLLFFISFFCYSLCIVDVIPKKFTREEVKAFKLARERNELDQRGLSIPPGSFERIFIIQFENQPFYAVNMNEHFNMLSKKGVLLTNYYGSTHPSQPNYWNQVAGSNFGIYDNENHDLPYTNLADLLTAKNISWKAYQEDYPGNCYTGKRYQQYVRKHNPFISFDSVRKTRLCENIVNAKQLDIDLEKGTLPQYSYYTPNNDNNGHDTGLTFAGNYLRDFFIPRLSKFPEGTLIIVTWDEDNYLSQNHIHTIALGSMVKPGTEDNTAYNHHSLLKTVEDNS